MATVRLDVTTETALKLLATRRGQTKSEVIRDAILRLAEAEPDGKPLTAFRRLQPFVGIVDSGGKQLSTETGKKVREILQEKQRARRPR